MLEKPNVSSGGFEVRRFRLRVSERVEFREEISDQINVQPIIDVIANLEVNPCAECTTIIDLVRALAVSSGSEPEEMGLVAITCQPDEKNTEFYQVMGKLPDGSVQYLNSVRCQLMPWVIDNINKFK